VLDVFVPQIVLDGAGVLTVVGELEPGRMSQHVRMDRHAQLGRIAGASEQLAEGGRGHRRAALGDKNVGAARIFTQYLAQAPEFRPAQRMGAGQPVLAAAYVQQALPQINLLAPQPDQFRHAEPVPVGEQDHRGIALTVAPETLGRGDQPVDFRGRQVFAAAPFGVGHLGWWVHGAGFPENDVW